VNQIEFVHVHSPISYGDALAIQQERHAAVVDGTASEAVFFLEHAPVITLGRSSHEANILRDRAALAESGIEVHETSRGGDVTYHGPGQLVAYPILNIRERGLSVKGYLRQLEEALIGLLATYGLQGERIPGMTGVWVEGAKVAAIGIGVRRWVTFHGTALNVDPDMAHFGLIVPCGIADKPVTSLRKLLGTAPPMEDVMDRYEHALRACLP